MDKRYYKALKIGIIVIILIIVIISIIIAVLSINKEKKIEKYLETRPYDIVLQKMQDKIGNNTYYTLKKCIEKYYNTISALNSNNSNDNYSFLLSILNKEYIEKEKINKDRIDEFYDNYKFNDFLIKKVYFTQNENNTTTYLVLGKQIDNNTDLSENYGFIILLDGNNKTFSIAPYEFIQKLNINTDTDISELIDISNINVDDKKYNLYDNSFINDELLIKNLFINYKKIAKYDPEYAYELLNEDYRNKHFNSKKEAEDYLMNNINIVLGNTIEKIRYDDSDSNSTIYMCQDNYKNIFVINKNDQIMEYNIMLDIYTIPSESITKQYNEANLSKKTAYKIEFFKQMINLKDYESAYNCLDKTFREQNFQGVQGFINYINNNLFEFISISYKDYELVGDLNTLKVIIKDRDGRDLREIQKTFIVKLNNDGTCTMSFNIE